MSGHSPQNPSTRSPGNNVRPISDLTWHAAGKKLTYDDTWLLDGKVVRICRPASPDEKPKGSVKVQFLMTGEEVLVMPGNLVELTPARRVTLDHQEFASLKLFDTSNEGCIGVDMEMGGRVMDTTVSRAADDFRPGDDAWLTGLTARPDLNDKHVMLNKWIEEKGRWQCLPMHWPLNLKGREDSIAIKAINLTKTPPSEGMDIGDGTEDDPFMGLRQAMERDGLDTSGMQTFSMTSGSKAEGATLEECLTNAQADSERIRCERREQFDKEVAEGKKLGGSSQPPRMSDGSPLDWSDYVPERSTEAFRMEYGCTPSQYVDTVIDVRLKEFPECYEGLSKKKAYAKAKKEWEDVQAARTPEQVAEGAMVMPPDWQDPVRTDGFQDWMAYVPKELKDGCKPSDILKHGLEYMPEGHPDRPKIQATYDKMLAVRQSV